MELILVILIAFTVAVLFSMIGLGGAIIYTPLFILLGLHPLTAIPMALLLNTITTASASITYLRQKMVDIKLAYPVILTSIPGAYIGSYFSGRVDTHTLIMLLSVILFLTSMRLLFFSKAGFQGISGRKRVVIGTGAGFIIGVVSALVGIGGGTFIVMLLLVIGLSPKNAAVTSAFISTFIALAGFLGHLSFGYENLDKELLLYAGVSAFVGAQTGSRVMFRRVSSEWINRIFAIVLLLVAVKLMWGLF
ncbi:MAG: sulfite exporter TauE/SafE family protein [Candidatus Methanoperedenaceae archaeon]|nr:sulfite exporter TauE/SafE family protein [Candidatus Methanoperedenaceae archaeon]MDW7727870.1 sulfite exporter TauE/SafE family protein [Candidatus Methanoperedens sp.]